MWTSVVLLHVVLILYMCCYMRSYRFFRYSCSRQTYRPHLLFPLTITLLFLTPCLSTVTHLYSVLIYMKESASLTKLMKRNNKRRLSVGIRWENNIRFFRNMSYLTVYNSLLLSVVIFVYNTVGR